MDIIHLLPDSVANQIAAGEVIQRPASVVKELVEDSIDAGATLITVIVKDAGKTSIQVIDNGKGMSETDARLAFERHATSKINNANDLFAISTMGFRGEALASIAAVAQVDLRTKLKDAELGTAIAIEGSKILSQELVQCPEGTQFTIKNLFFNVPARRKFLKTDETELRNIIQEMYRIVLANPNISFRLYQDKDIIFDLIASNQKKRIVDVFSRKRRNIVEQLVRVEVDTVIAKIEGYVGIPQSAGKNVPQYFFVNGRYMNHPYFRRAVAQAYDRMIDSDSLPMFFLSFTVDPATIDVNIHPTKTEIKFENEREIWSILVVAIKESLGKFNIIPPIDFDVEGKVDMPLVSKNEVPKMPQISYNPNYNPFNNTHGNGNVRNWESMFESKRNAGFDVNIGNNKDDLSDSLIPLENDNFKDSLDFSFTESILYNEKYLLFVSKNLYVVDLKKAYFRIYFDKVLKLVDNQGLSISQKLLFPEIMDITEDEQCILNEVEVELNNLGFVLSDFGKNMIQIEAIPALISDESIDVTVMLHDVIDNIKAEANGVDSLKSILAQSVALNYSQLKKISVLSADQRNDVLHPLFDSTNPYLAPDGSVIIKTLNQFDIDKILSVK